MYVRVRDPQTGHEFDRKETDPAVLSGRFVPVKGNRYPPSREPRPAKHHIKLAGRSASRETAAAQAAADEAPEKENPDG